MSNTTYLNKVGLYEGKIFDEDIVAGKFKPYTYTQKEANTLRQSTLVPVLKVQTREKLKVKNGILFFNGQEHDLSKMSLREVLNVLNESEPVASFIKGYSDFSNLPAYFLTDFLNTNVVSLKATYSPFNYVKRIPPFLGLIEESTVVTSFLVYDFIEGKELDRVIEGDFIYYNPTQNSDIILTIVAESFYMCVDFNTKILTGASGICNIIKNKEEEHD